MRVMRVPRRRTNERQSNVQDSHGYDDVALVRRPRVGGAQGVRQVLRRQVLRQLSDVLQRRLLRPGMLHRRLLRQLPDVLQVTESD